jgi:hypothetical protein
MWTRWDDIVEQDTLPPSHVPHGSSLDLSRLSQEQVTASRATCTRSVQGRTVSGPSAARWAFNGGGVRASVRWHRTARTPVPRGTLPPKRAHRSSLAGWQLTGSAAPQARPREGRQSCRCLNGGAALPPHALRQGVCAAHPMMKASGQDGYRRTGERGPRDRRSPE